MRLIISIILCFTVLNPLNYAFANEIIFKPQPLYKNSWNQKTIPSITFPLNIPSVTKNYYWYYNGNSYYFTIQVPLELLEWSRNVNKQIDYYYELNGNQQKKYLNNSPIKNLIIATHIESKGNYTSWINEPKNNKFIKLIAEQLNNQANLDGYNKFQKAEFILGFVQSIPYFEVETRLPSQTLVDYGDCDCKSILYATIMKHLGYKVGLVKLYGKEVDHMATIISFENNEIPSNYEPYYINNNIKYYYCETIGECSIIGDELGLGNNSNKIIHIIN